MVPMPTDSLKNDRPIATSTVAHVTLLKSGRNRKTSPSLAPGSVRLRTMTISSRTNSAGTSRFVIRSMPFDTPAMMMAAIMASTSHCQSSDCTGLLISPLKAAAVTCGSTDESWPNAALKM